MKANYSRTGKERKELVNAIAEITGEKAEYLGTPTYAYRIGSITVDENGGVICDDEDKLSKVIAALDEKGIRLEEAEPTLTISVPIEAVNVGTLTSLLSAKESLIKKALGVSDTRIRVTEDKVEFPWFDRELTPEETNAYMLFITQLCKLSKELKHASSRPVETDNEKYAFRTWLLRMGFIGPDFKAARKILLRNLSGSSAFRNGSKPE
jgi:hypothetical protein